MLLSLMDGHFANSIQAAFASDCPAYIGIFVEDEWSHE